MVIFSCIHEIGVDMQNRWKCICRRT